MSRFHVLGAHLAPIAFAGAVPARLNQDGKPCGDPTFALIHLSPALIWRQRVATREDLPPGCTICVDRWNHSTLCDELYSAGFDVYSAAITNAKRHEISGLWQFMRLSSNRDASAAVLAALDRHQFPAVRDLPDVAKAFLLAMAVATPRLLTEEAPSPPEVFAQKPGLQVALNAGERGGGASTAKIADFSDIGADRCGLGFSDARLPKQNFVTGRIVTGGDLARKPRPHADDRESHADHVVKRLGMAVHFVDLALQPVKPLGVSFRFHARPISDLFSAASSPQGDQRRNALAVAL